MPTINLRAITISALSAIAAVTIWMLVVERAARLIESREMAETQRYDTTLSTGLGSALQRRLAVFSGLKSFVDHNLREMGRQVDGSMKSRMTSFVRPLYENITGFRNFSLAPQGKQAWVFPLKGNEKTLGHDLLNDPRSNVRADVQRAIRTGKQTFSGLYQLRQGGLGLIVRQAIFVDENFWGLIAMVIDMPPIIEASGVEGPQKNT